MCRVESLNRGILTCGLMFGCTEVSGQPLRAKASALDSMWNQNQLKQV